MTEIPQYIKEAKSTWIRVNGQFERIDILGPYKGNRVIFRNNRGVIVSIDISEVICEVDYEEITDK